MEHMCSVASGLDSQVLGEHEILGQFKKSIQSFVELDVLDSTLKRITDEIISITKDPKITYFKEASFDSLSSFNIPARI